jgi:Na+-driven multidrug efflux pump
MKQKQIFLNAATTFGQELASAGILFLLYRFLIHAIGIERFGVWSLVLATTSVVTLANQGLSTSIVKFVAKYASQEKSNNVSVLVQTALISIGIGLAVFSVGLYSVALWMLKLLLPSAMLAQAYPLLPFALVSLWLNVSGSILLAGLAGFQKITHRNYVVLGSAILFFVALLRFRALPRPARTRLCAHGPICGLFAGNMDSPAARASQLSFNSTSLESLALSGNARLWPSLSVCHSEPGRSRTGDKGAAGKIWRNRDDGLLRYRFPLGRVV